MQESLKQTYDIVTTIVVNPPAPSPVPQRILYGEDCRRSCDASIASRTHPTASGRVAAELWRREGANGN
jgi:hypothetical protein